MKQIRQVMWGSIRDDIAAYGRNLIINSLGYRKPMQFSQEGCNMSALGLGGFEIESSRTILKVVNKLLRNPCKERDRRDNTKEETRVW